MAAERLLFLACGLEDEGSDTFRRVGVANDVTDRCDECEAMAWAVHRINKIQEICGHFCLEDQIYIIWEGWETRG